jgi:hypothetical protein
MLLIYDKDGQACVIRPTPLVSISSNPLRNKMGNLGSTYDIVLTGTIIADEGSPFSHLTTNKNGPHGGGVETQGSFEGVYTRPNGEIINFYNEANPSDGDLPRLKSIFHKQNALRQLFSVDGIRMEFTPVNSPVIVCFPKLISINFQEGLYIHTCNYTITLQANLLLNDANKIFYDGVFGLRTSFNPTGIIQAEGKTPAQIIENYGGLIEDFTENWSFEVDDSQGETVESYGNNGSENTPPNGFWKHRPRAYRLTRNVTAVGRDGWIPVGDGTSKKLLPWEQAKNFLTTSVLSRDLTGFTDYPNRYKNNNRSSIDIPLNQVDSWEKNSTLPTHTQQADAYRDNSNTDVFGPFSEDVINLVGVYRGFNHARTESIDKTAGSCSISDTWLLCSGTAYETYNLSINSSIDNAFPSVNINGVIKGLTTIPASGVFFGGSYVDTHLDTPIENAKVKYNQISNGGKFGLISSIYKRAANALGSTLNSQPKSIALGINEFTGEITYSVDFDNRPINVISGVLSENITVNDTYPGDIFAVIPVLGRQTGPVLQYIGSRTEYRRDVGIEIQLDYTDVPYGSGRNPLLLAKPSVNEPIRSQLNGLVKQLSPAYEPGVRKYFLSPPTENWIPKEGRYSLNLSWTYELDH